MGLPAGFIGGIGTGELVVILVVALLVLGPKQLPEAARNLAKALRAMRKAADDVKDEIGLDEIMHGRPAAAKHVALPRTARSSVENPPPAIQTASAAPAAQAPQGTAVPEAADVPGTGPGKPVGEQDQGDGRAS